MTRTSASVLRDGVILNNRYRIIKQIARGSCGRAYLSEDIHRYRELCVLEEFAPRVESERELQHAADLFEQKAGILHRIGHSQIPRWEALLHTIIDGKRSLFLVREHIEGETYRQLLWRKGKLSETEVTKMIWEVLSILDYIHASRLFHGNITPENLILRHSDCKTVLTNFSCIQIAANAVARTIGGSLSSICDRDYCPDEQLRCGRASGCSDLYSLAATAVVLLTGKQPNQLYDVHQGRWNWEEVRVSSGLRKILNKMLAAKPCDRYQSADRVRQMLSKAKNSVWHRVVSLLWTASNSDSVSHANYPPRFPRGLRDSTSRFSSNAENDSRRRLSNIPGATNFKEIRPWQWGMLASAVILVPGLISFATIRTRMAVRVASERHYPNSAPNVNEQDLQQNIYQRVELLELNAAAFYRQVDAIFYNRYPELEGISLTESKQHQQYRKLWYQIASNLLDERVKKQ